MSRRCLVVLLALFAVAGCDTKSGSPPLDLVKSQREAMEKSKGVERTLQQSADRKRDEEAQK